MKVIIIGAGPCGIMSAITYKKNHPQDEVIILEKSDKIGQRIKVSGNGRCNFSNSNFSPSKYNHPEFVNNYDKELSILNSYYKETGFCYFSDEEGRMYPNSETSSSYLYILTKLMKKYKVEVSLSSKVESICKMNNEYHIATSTTEYIADKVVISIGGASLNYKLEEYNKLISSIKLDVVPFNPSLTPINTSSFSKKMEGRRVKASVRLLFNNKIAKEERGEVLFKRNGVSGIVIFNMSSYLARLHLSTYKGYSLSIDMLPNLDQKQISDYLILDPSYKTLLQEDIADYIVENKINPKDFKLDVVSLYELKDSQVSSGGININQLNEDLSLKCDHNIFAGGEAIDIDGECGGYNIEFALLSGIRIGNNI